MYVTAILNLRFSLDDSTSDYEFLPPIANAFTVDPEDYYSRRYKVNDFKAHKSFHLNWNITLAMPLRSTECFVLSNLIKRISDYTYVLDPSTSIGLSNIQNQNSQFKTKITQDNVKKTSIDVEHRWST